MKLRRTVGDACVDETSLSVSLTREDHAFLNVARVSRNAYVRQPQKRVRRDIADLNAVAFLHSSDRQNPRQRSIEHPCPAESKGPGGNRIGHKK